MNWVKAASAARAEGGSSVKSSKPKPRTRCIADEDRSLTRRSDQGGARYARCEGPSDQADSTYLHTGSQGCRRAVLSREYRRARHRSRHGYDANAQEQCCPSRPCCKIII